MALLQKVKTEIHCFNSPADLQRYKEIVRLRDYLEYKLRLQEYNATLEDANGNAEQQRAQYIKAKLDEFDNAEKSRAEEEKWGWSPLYHIFKEWPLSSAPNSPWAHTQEEWVGIENSLLQNVSIDPLSLELECPHIVRAFLVLFRNMHGHTRPLPHPAAGLTLDYILDFAVDSEKSVALTNVVHNLATSGWTFFPGINYANDNFSNMHSDTVALLGYEPKKQVAVVEKIRAFLGRVAHRVVSDMVRMGRSSELRDVWFADEVLEQHRAKCNEV